MNKNLKSLLWSFTIVLGIIYSTYVWVKIFWNTSNNDVLNLRVKFIVYLKFLLIPIYVVSIYHIVGVYRVDNFYYPLIIFELIYIFGGITIGIFLPEKNDDKKIKTNIISIDELYRKKTSNNSKKSN